MCCSRKHFPMSVLIFSNEWSKDTGQQNDSDGQQDIWTFLASNDLFKVNNRNGRKSYEISSKLTINTS